MTSTADRTIRRGVERAGGWRDLEQGPGSPHQGRLAAGAVPLAALWHLSDLHLCDAESPVRLQYLDRSGDPELRGGDDFGVMGLYRPQETLTVQVAVSMVETVNALTHGPVTGRPVDSAVVTGDVVDNAQGNELDWYRTLIAGGTIIPASGDPERSCWVGATHPDTWEERYWHPDGPPTGLPDDVPTRLHGYPRIPGLVGAARRPVVSPGLAVPTLTVHGNHDLLLQGCATPSERARSLALGDRRVLGLPGSPEPLALDLLPERGPARYPHDPLSPTAPVVPDPARRLVVPGDFGPTTWWSDVGGVRLIALDTVNPHGGWQGSVPVTQLEWLRALLDDADRPVVVVSHHPSWCLRNDYSPPGAERRVLADAVIPVLLDSPWVVAWLAGHVHQHCAVHHGPEGGGFWEITTASLIDWPQQAGVVELAIEPSGRVAVAVTAVDHDSPLGWSPGRLGHHAELAAISRALAANDFRTRAWQGHEGASATNAVWRSRSVG